MLSRSLAAPNRGMPSVMPDAHAQELVRFENETDLRIVPCNREYQKTNKQKTRGTPIWTARSEAFDRLSLHNYYYYYYYICHGFT